MWTILKFFIGFVTMLPLFYVFIFWWGCEACGILAPQWGIEPTPAVLEGEVLTTGLRGKALLSVIKPSPFWTHRYESHI